jgi:hypothetical protein
MLALTASRNLILRQFDVKTAFLYGDLDEEIFMHQPEGFGDGTDRICLLKKSLYGLKQAPRAWNSTFDAFLKKLNFKQSKSDSCLYTDEQLVIVLYVDDGLIPGESVRAIEAFVSKLTARFEAKCSTADFYLGIEITHNRVARQLKVHQGAYVNSLVDRFGMRNANSVSTPAETSLTLRRDPAARITTQPYRQLIGTLMYLAVCSRPDIAFAVGKLSRYLDCATDDHWNAAKRVVRYLKGTPNHGITYDGNTQPSNLLQLYTDADFGMCLDTRKSTSGVVVTLNSGPVVWSSHKQSVVATSTTEAEFIAAHDGTREVVWFRRITSDMNATQPGPTELYCDNSTTTRLISGEACHKQTKRIDIKFQSVRDHAERGEIKIPQISTKDQLADSLTKTLPKTSFVNILNLLNFK